MFIHTFRDALNEFAYDAELSGLAYTLSNTKHGVMLYIRGYNQKQHVLLEKILDKLVQFKVDAERFAVLKENYGRGLKNFEMEQPNQHAVHFNTMMLSEKFWQKQELLQALGV